MYCDRTEEAALKEVIRSIQFSFETYENKSFGGEDHQIACLETLKSELARASGKVARLISNVSSYQKKMYPRP